jgi:hypothetical protein
MQIESQSPILIGGENRSGTTLVGVTLDAHPEVVMGSEIDFVSPSFEKIRNGELYEPEERFLRQLGRFGIDTERAQSLIELEVYRLGANPLSYHERCIMMARIGEYRARAGAVSRWGFQIQRQITNTELIGLSLPKARFIHVVRDGRDVAASHLKLNNKNWTYKTIEDAALGWSSLLQRVRETDDPTLVQVRYEDIVYEPQTTLKKLLGNLGLTWSDYVLSHTDASHDLLLTPSDHPSANQVSQPLYNKSVGAYKNILSKNQIDEFEKIAGEELEAFGYK